MKYRKKPIVVEAVRYSKDSIAVTLDFVPADKIWYSSGVNDYYIKTLEGDHKCSEGDYIIKGVTGEFYPCKPDIFEQTYESADKPVTNFEHWKKTVTAEEMSKIIYCENCPAYGFPHSTDNPTLDFCKDNFREWAEQEYIETEVSE